MVSLILLALQVLEQHIKSAGVLTELGDDSHGATDNLSRLASGIDLAQTDPLAKLIKHGT